MCTTCGCSETAQTKVTNLDTGVVQSTHHHDHSHDHDHASHDHGHHHHHDHDHTHTVALQKSVLEKNDTLAEQNRSWFVSKNILALNLVSSPGSGKTTLLVRTLRDLMPEYEVSVVEGDQETLNDAKRIKETGCPVVQVNTGTGCHLEADMLAKGIQQIQPSTNSLVFIENVGNLVCPALFDLGEFAKVAILSVTEGEDKPLKYPHMFKASDVMIISKVDLLPYLDFDVELCARNAKSINPNIQVILLSATSGEGLDQWYQWIVNAQQKVQQEQKAVAE